MNKLNELMAEKVMGWTCRRVDSFVNGEIVYMWYTGKSEIGFRVDRWNPTEDIAQAMRCLITFANSVQAIWVVRKLRNGEIYCKLSNTPNDGEAYKKYSARCAGNLEELPKAICEAISEAIGSKQ